MTVTTVDSVLSELCVKWTTVVDKTSGTGRMSLYFNIKLSVLSGPLSYVDSRHFFQEFGHDSLSSVDKNWNPQLSKWTRGY